MQYFLIYILTTTRFSFTISANDYNLSNKQGKSLKSLKLPACQACKMLVEPLNSEVQLITNTISNGKNKQQNQTTTNEIEMFQHIFMSLCKEERGQDQCRSLSEKCKDDLQTWWLKDRNEIPDLINYLCIDKLRYCCHSGHYGPECKPCPGYPDRVCNNNGKCKGNGTRKGNGQCSCDVGYSGHMCDECAPSYYVSYKDDNKMLCVRCHAACEDDCSGAGAHACVMCRKGWRMDKTKGCIDVNECFSKRPPCKRAEFCVNNEGSYSCLACDPSCDTCTGDGPDMCDKCAHGFFLQDNICVNQRSYASYSDITRYLTYIGLCFATYIIFQNNLWAASIIGICVAIYMTVSEYMLGTITLTHLFSLTKAVEDMGSLW